MYDWVSSNVNEKLPANAVCCGRDEEDSDVYIGRVRHKNTMLLVKIVPRKGEASFPYYDEQHFVTEYEVLVNLQDEQPIWVNSRDGHVPPNAVQCGFNKNGTKLYVGRVHHQELHVPGYIHPFYRGIFFPFGSKAHFSKFHEVLVHNVPYSQCHCARE